MIRRRSPAVNQAPPAKIPAEQSEQPGDTTRAAGPELYALLTWVAHMGAAC